MWSFDLGSQKGLTLFEMLVVLAILGVALGALASFRPVPSPLMRLEALANQLINDASLTRAAAIRSGSQTEFVIKHTLCPESPDRIWFFPNGTATQTRICIQTDTAPLWLEIDPLTAIMRRVDVQ